MASPGRARRPPGGPPGEAGPPVGRSGRPHVRGIAAGYRGPRAGGYAATTVLPIATLISWLLTAGFGAYMFGSWIAHGGVQQRLAKGEGLGPAIVFSHVSLAITGLALWTAYAITRWSPLAWSAVLVLMPVIGLGLSTVTLWVPYPNPGGVGRVG